MLIFLVLALVAGAAAIIMVYQLIASYQQKIKEATKPEETAMAVVAAGDLFPGLVITEQDLVQVQIPKQYLPADALTSAELVVGRIPRERILANEFVRPGRLADIDSGLGLNALIPEGMRAMSVGVADGAQVSGFLQPGNLVDILVTITPDTADPGSTEASPTTTTLLQSVTVLALNGRMFKEDAGKAKNKKRTVNSVTFALTPDQAEQVTYASLRGAITLDLRNSTDQVNVVVPNITNQDLVPAKPVEKKTPKWNLPPPSPPPDNTTTMQVIRGGQKSTLTIHHVDHSTSDGGGN